MKGYNDAKAEMASRVLLGSHQFVVDVKDTFYRGGEDELRFTRSIPQDGDDGEVEVLPG